MLHAHIWISELCSFAHAHIACTAALLRGTVTCLSPQSGYSAAGLASLMPVCCCLTAGGQERTARRQLLPEAEPGPVGCCCFQHGLLHLQCSNCRYNLLQLYSAQSSIPIVHHLISLASMRLFGSLYRPLRLSAFDSVSGHPKAERSGTMVCQKPDCGT